MYISTGEIHPFYGAYEFAPFDSLVIIDDGTQRKNDIEKKEQKILSIDGEWIITEQSMNVLTLDYCKYYFDGEVVEDKGYVLNIQNRACALKRPVNIKQVFEISVIGIPIKNEDVGYFVDSSFRKIPIQENFRVGENSIVRVCKTCYIMKER